MNVYQIVTERIIKMLEQGVAPWRKPWKTAGAPRNFITKKPYRGINFLLLHQGHSSPFWLTYRQAVLLGGTVNKGQKATPIVFWKVRDANTDTDNPEQEERGRRFILRYYNVFNMEQTSLARAASQFPMDPLPEPITVCADVLEGWKEKPILELHNKAEARAAYSPRLDIIVMPVLERFRSTEHYFATLFHELVHSTGHPSRLNRPGVADVNAFGSETYSKEELIAECGAAFLCGHTGIDSPAVEENSAAYLQHWIDVLKGDSRLIVSAAAQAQQAVDLILQKADEQQDEEEQ